MNPAGRFRNRNPLDAVYASLVFEMAVGPLPFNQHNDILVASNTRFGAFNRIDLEPFFLRVLNVQAKQLTGEQGRFVAASAGPNFQHQTLVIPRIFRNQEFLHLRLQFSPPMLQRSSFFCCHHVQFIASRRVGEHLGGFVKLPGAIVIGLK